MRLGPLTPARFVRRLNRFAAVVEVGGGRALAHVANSGRLGELLVPGFRVYLRARGRAGRRCPYDLALVRAGRTLVSVDARLPNALLKEALHAGRIAPLRGYGRRRAEVRHGASRFDFLLERPGARCLVETKSVTLVERGVALFPDAPTARGRRHVEALTRAVRRGRSGDGRARPNPPPIRNARRERMTTEAAVVFVVQRPDARRFRPHAGADPALARALARAARAGVRVLAYTCRVSRRAIAIVGPIPVELGRKEGPRPSGDS